MARPRKVKWPVTLDELLRLTFRGKRPEDRWKIFRESRRKYLSGKLNREPTDNELGTDIIEWKQNKYYDSYQVLAWMDNMRMDFLPAFHKENRQKRAQAAALKSWSKENREKRMEKKR